VSSGSMKWILVVMSHLSYFL